MVCSRWRIRSGDASDRASPSGPAGSTIWAAVIVMTPFERAVRGELEGSHGGRAHVLNDVTGHRATPLCGTQLSSETQRTALAALSGGLAIKDVAAQHGGAAGSSPDYATRTPNKHDCATRVLDPWDLC